MTFFKSMMSYFRFFTRIYIPGSLDKEVHYLNRGSKYLPIFGLLTGAGEGAAFFVLNLGLSGTLSFVLTLVLDACLTGAMHQDGFADLADGIFSSRKQDRMLEIMKDSRLGTMGALALIFYYLLMVSIFFEYEKLFLSWHGFCLILVMTMVGKSDITILFFRMKYHNAKGSGLGQIWSGVLTSDIVVAQIISLCVLVLIYQWIGMIIYVIQLLFLIGYRRFIYRKLGGLNGDAMGGVVPIANIILLFSVGFLEKLI